MTEENNNQPAIPPNDYQNHLIWRNIFIYIILPIQFVGNLSVLYQHIIGFYEYSILYVTIVLCGCIITLFSIAIVLGANIKKNPIGYKVIQFYSIFIIIYKTINLILAFAIIYYTNVGSDSLLSDILNVLIFIITAIINLIYFSHRKFLFGIPDEQSTPPESKEEESKENHQ